MEYVLAYSKILCTKLVNFSRDLFLAYISDNSTFGSSLFKEVLHLKR